MTLATHAITQGDLVFVLIILAVLVLLFWLIGHSPWRR